MEQLDYTSLGLTCGLEIHQQLETHKLFCNCPSLIRDDPAHRIIRRRLRAAAGESENIDTAALAEMKKETYYVYESYDDTTCLVELDEEPPHQVNQEALDTSLMVAKLLHAEILESVQIMRKTVVDGSNTSGFQRTALIALDGKIPTSYGDVGIQSVCLEEDAAKIVERTGEFTKYNLSKLGIPLVEIATAPHIHHPEHAKETAAYIGMVLRSTRRVKRGLGTIRQDLNVSIKGGNRIEIKGAQDLKLVPLWVHNEALRQRELLKIKENLPRNLTFPLKIADVTNVVAHSTSKIIAAVLEKKGKVLGIRLPHFAHLLGKEVQPNRRLGTEFSDYAKVAAGIGGIIHSDEQLDKYGLSDENKKSLSLMLECEEKDAFVLVCAQESKARKALEAVHHRALMCSHGVPMEVRQPKEDGTSSFMRPVPTADRMYPETDCHSATIDIKKIVVPMLLEEQKKHFKKKYQLPDDQVNALFSEQKEELFEKCMKQNPSLKAGFIAEVLISTETELQRKEKIDTAKITDQHYEQVLHALAHNSISKQSLVEIFLDIAKTGKLQLDNYASMPENEVRASIEKIAKGNAGVPFNVLMGKVMAVLRGKADGALISRLVKEYAHD